MPECYFYSRFSKFLDKIQEIGLQNIRYDFVVITQIWIHLSTTFISDACHNKECPFLHIDPESKIRDCPWYDRGFCRHGPSCRHRHVRRELCMNYLAGFCPDGPECPNGHPRFEIPVSISKNCVQSFGTKFLFYWYNQLYITLYFSINRYHQTQMPEVARKLWLLVIIAVT